MAGNSEKKDQVWPNYKKYSHPSKAQEVTVGEYELPIYQVPQNLPRTHGSSPVSKHLMIKNGG